MIFVGDTAIPYVNSIRLDLPLELKQKNFFLNLEGAIINNNYNLNKSFVVFNDRHAIKTLIDEISVKGMALSNNHIFDAGSYDETISILKELGVPHCGIGENDIDAARPLVLEENGITVVIYNLGWEIIGCRPPASKGRMGINPLTRNNAIKIILEARDKYPGSKILFFMHWNYEHEELPQPLDRELARILLDYGADGIIGAHPHRIGCIEYYNGKPIIYSLGNWMFKQNYFWNGKSQFQNFSSHELAFEWIFDSNEMFLHFFYYDKKESVVRYINTECIESGKLEKYKINHFSNREYIDYYKKNRYHKNNMLPVYYFSDSDMVISLKNLLFKIRGIITKMLRKIIKKNNCENID